MPPKIGNDLLLRDPQIHDGRQQRPMPQAPTDRPQRHPQAIQKHGPGPSCRVAGIVLQIADADAGRPGFHELSILPRADRRRPALRREQEIIGTLARDDKVIRYRLASWRIEHGRHIGPRLALRDREGVADASRPIRHLSHSQAHQILAPQHEFDGEAEQRTVADVPTLYEHLHDAFHLLRREGFLLTRTLAAMMRDAPALHNRLKSRGFLDKTGPLLKKTELACQA